MTKPLVLFAGPCAIESLETCRTIAEVVAKIGSQFPGVTPVFKASFDKANRSSLGGFRGPGLDEGLEVLATIGREFGLPVVTDVHSVEQAHPVAEVATFLQVPAFLCRQTDLLQVCASTGRSVMVKKGQFLAPQNTLGIVEKLRHFGCEDILLCERGTSFGHNDLVVDFRGLVEMRQPQARVVYDATHSVQRPGALGHASGGNREYIYPLARAAVAVGVDGLFFETHPDPDNALSDGPNTLPLGSFLGVIESLLAIHNL